MSLITATTLPAFAAIRLEVTGLPDGPATITRTDANGVGQVRMLPGQTSTAGVLLVTDYEAALTGEVTYAVDDATTTTELGVPFPVLAAAGRPNLRFHPTAITGYGETTDSSSAAVRILDRDDPIVLEADHWLPSGTLTAWCASFVDARALAAVARSGRRIMFRQADHPGMDAYLTFSSTAITAETPGPGPQRWAVTLGYDTVATPTTDLLSAAGWDFDAVTASFATFDELTAAFTTFNALTVGP